MQKSQNSKNNSKLNITHFSHNISNTQDFNISSNNISKIQQQQELLYSQYNNPLKLMQKESENFGDILRQLICKKCSLIIQNAPISCSSCQNPVYCANCFNEIQSQKKQKNNQNTLDCPKCQQHFKPDYQIHKSYEENFQQLTKKVMKIKNVVFSKYNNIIVWDQFKKIKISNFRPVKDSLYTREYIVFKIDFDSSYVERRYTDFLALHQHLLKQYQGHIIPKLPPKHSIENKVQQAVGDYGYTQQFLNERRENLEIFLQLIYGNKNFKDDIILKNFLLQPKFEHPEDNYYQECVHTLLAGAQNLNDTIDFGIAYLSVKFSNPVLKYSDITPQNIAKINKLSENIYKLCQMVQKEQKQLEQIYNCLLVVQSNPQNLFKNLFNTKNQMEQEEEDIYQSIDSLDHLKDQNKIQQNQKQEQNQKLNSQILKDSGLQDNDESYLLQEQQSLIQKSVLIDQSLLLDKQTKINENNNQNSQIEQEKQQNEDNNRFLTEENFQNQSADGNSNSSFQQEQENQGQNLNTTYIERKIENCKEMRILNKFLLTKIDIIWRRIEGLHFATQTIIIHFDDIQARASIRDKKRAAQKYDEERKIVEQINILAQQLKNMTQRLEKDSTDLLNTIRVEFNNIIRQFKLLKIWETLIQVRPDDLFSTSEIIREYEERDKRYYLRDIKNQEFEEIDEQDLIAIQLNIDKDDINKTNKSQNQNYQMQEIEVDDNQYIEKPIKILNSNKINSKNKNNDQLNLSEIQQDQDGIYRDNLLFEQALHNEDEEIEIMLQKQLKGHQKSFEQIEQIEKEELNPQQEQDLHNLIFNSMNGKKQGENEEDEEENKNNSFQNEQKPNKQQKKNEFDYSPDIISSQAPQNQHKNNKELEMNLEQMENSSLCSQNNDSQQGEIEQDLNSDNESKVSQDNSANQNNSNKNQLSQSNNSPMETESESEHESEAESGNQKRSQKQKNNQESFVNKSNSENQNPSLASQNLSQNGTMNQDQNQTKSQIQIQNLSLNFNENQNQKKNQDQEFQSLTLQKNIVTSQLVGTIQAQDHPQRLTKSGQIQELENQQNQLNNSYNSPEFKSSENSAQKQKGQKLKHKKFKNFQDQSEEESEEGENREEEEQKEQNEEKINFAQSKNQNSQTSSQYNNNSNNNSLKQSSNNNSNYNQKQNIKKQSEYLSSFHQSQKKFKEDSLNFENSDNIPSQLKQSQSENANNQMFSSQNNQNIQNSNYKQFNEEFKNSENFQNIEQNINLEKSQQSQQICNSGKSEDMQQSVFLHPQKLQQGSENFLDFNFPHLKNLDAKNQQLNKENNENPKQTILNLQNLNPIQFDHINKSQNLNTSHPIQNILHSQKIDSEEIHNKLNKSKVQEFVSNQPNIQHLNLLQQNSQQTISLHHQPQSQPQSLPQASSHQNPLANSKLNKQNSQNSFPSLGLSEFPLIPNPNFQNNYQDSSQILDPMKMNKNCSLNMDLGIESGESMKLSMEIVNQIQQNLRVSDQKSKKIQSNKNPIQNEKNHPILKINNQFQQVNFNEQIDERSENSQEMSDTIQYRKKQSSSSVENSLNKKQKLQNHKSLNLYDNIGPLDYTKSYDPNNSPQKIEQLLLNSKNTLDKSNSHSKHQHKSYFVKNPKSLFKPKNSPNQKENKQNYNSSSEYEDNFQCENQNQNSNQNENSNINENENENEEENLNKNLNEKENCKNNIDLGQSLQLKQQQSLQQQEFQAQNSDEEQQYFQQFNDQQKLQSLNQSQKMQLQQQKMENSENKSNKSIDSSQFQNQDLHNKIEQAEKQLEQLNQIKQQNQNLNKSQNSLSSSDDEQDFFDAKEDFQDDFKNEEEEENENNNNIEFVDIQNQNQKENNKKYDFTNYQQFLNSIQDLNLKKLFLCISLIPNQVQEKNILNLSQSLQQSQQDYIEQFVDKFFKINWKKMDLENQNKKINMKEIYTRFFSNQSYFSDFSQMNYQNFFSYLIQEFIDETSNFKSSNLYPEIHFDNLNNLENNDQYKLERTIQFQVKKSQNTAISNKKFQITQCIYPLSVQLIFIENIIEISQTNQQYEQNQQEIYPLTAKVYYLLEENQNNNINNNDISIQMGCQVLINNQDNYDIQEINKISHFIEEKLINNFKNQIQQEIQTNLNQIQKQQEQNQFKNQQQDNQMLSDSLI